MLSSVSLTGLFAFFMGGNDEHIGRTHRATQGYLVPAVFFYARACPSGIDCMAGRQKGPFSPPIFF